MKQPYKSLSNSRPVQCGCNSVQCNVMQYTSITDISTLRTSVYNQLPEPDCEICELVRKE